jgi:hypothetical protein
VISAPVKVLYIAGSGRSCTTLLGHILGQVKRFCFIGEAMYGWRSLGDRLCGCGVPLENCGFWNAVRREASGDGLVDPSEFFGLGRLARWRHLPLTLLPARERRLEARFGRHWRGCERLYETAAGLSGADVVVDSSKSVPYLRMLSLLPGLDVRVVHVVRDARAVAHSWKRQKPAPDRSRAPYMRYRGPVRSALAWSVSNVGAELFAGPPARYLRIRYEDFALHPRRSVERILRMVTASRSAYAAAGCAAGGLALPFSDERTVELRPTHSIKGNPDRLQTGPVEVRLDDRWRIEMTPADRRLVTALSWPFLAHYGYLGGGRRA